MFKLVTGSDVKSAPADMATKRKCPSKACICSSLTVWMFFAVVSLIAVTYVYTGSLFRLIRHVETYCRVESCFYTTQFICRCQEGYDCVSVYPCFLVHVGINASDGEMWVVSLFKDDAQQSATQEASHDTRESCSLKVCQKDEADNRRIVQEFEEHWGQRGSFIPCAYDPWDIQAGAVLKVEQAGMKMFHALFWPFVCILIGVVICIVFCRRCRKEDAKKDILEAASKVLHPEEKAGAAAGGAAIMQPLISMSSIAASSAKGSGKIRKDDTSEKPSSKGPFHAFKKNKSGNKKSVGKSAAKHKSMPV